MKKLKEIKRKTIIAALLLLCAISLLPVSAQAASKTKLDATKKTIYVGDSCTVKILNNKKNVKWSVSNKKVIKITSKNKKKAKIKGLKKGTSYLNAKVGKKTYKCKVKVKKIACTYLSLSQKSAYIYAGKTLKLTATRSPINTTDELSFSSSNKSVATVDGKGNITAKKEGTCAITVTCGKIKETCTVNVLSTNGTRENPISAYAEYTTDIYDFSTYIGKFKVKMLDYKDGEDAWNIVSKNDFNTKPGDSQEYIYVKFEITYLQGSRQVDATDVISCYSDFFNSGSNYQLDNMDWGYRFEDVDDMADVSLYPGGHAVCSKAVLVRSGNTPITYRIQTGYDDSKYEPIYTWFTAAK